MFVHCTSRLSFKWFWTLIQTHVVIGEIQQSFPPWHLVVFAPSTGTACNCRDYDGISHSFMQTGRLCLVIGLPGCLFLPSKPQYVMTTFMCEKTEFVYVSFLWNTNIVSFEVFCIAWAVVSYRAGKYRSRTTPQDLQVGTRRFVCSIREKQRLKSALMSAIHKTL